MGPGITVLAEKRIQARKVNGFVWRRRDVVAWMTAHPRVAVMTTAVSLFLFAGSYYVNIARPAAARAKVEAEAQAVSTMKVQMASRGTAQAECLTKAESEAKAHWDAQCRRERKGANCALSRKLTQILEREAGVGRNACLMKYSLTQ